MLRPMLRALVGNPLRRIGTPAWGMFSPRSLFAAGEQGVWYDPSDFSTLFQDSGGTTPVTAAGQAVGLVRDKSGRANHLTLSNCTLQQDAGGLWYLAFNGTTTGGSAAAINFTATSQVTTWAGLYKASDAAFAILCELSANLDVNNGSFYLSAPNSAAPNVAASMKGAGTNQGISSGAIHAAPVTLVVTHQADMSAPSQVLRTNGVQRASISTSAGAGPFGNYPFFVGGRNNSSSRFNGRLYGLIVRGAATDATRIAQTERWMGRKTGVAL